jgi:hypothetical protein
MASRPRLVAKFPSAAQHVGDQPHGPARWCRYFSVAADVCARMMQRKAAFFHTSPLSSSSGFDQCVLITILDHGRLDAQYGALYRTEDFVAGRKAEAEGRPPTYRGH